MSILYTYIKDKQSAEVADKSGKQYIGYCEHPDGFDLMLKGAFTVAHMLGVNIGFIKENEDGNKSFYDNGKWFRIWKLHVDEKVLVWNNGDTKVRRFLSHFENGRIYTFAEGATSETAEGVTSWDNWILASLEERGE